MACLLDADDPALLGLVFLFVRNLSMGRMKGNFVLVCFLALRSTNYYGWCMWWALRHHKIP